jgi:pimeloyl-ACP methyl ester carboxylesterase
MTALITIVVIFLAGAAATMASAWLIERRNPPHGRFIEVHGLRRHIVELGNSSNASDNLPIVLLHGAGANLKDMEIAVGERLAARHRVILVDRPGFGFSARKKGGENTPTEQAVILDERWRSPSRWIIRSGSPGWFSSHRLRILRCVSSA